MIGAIVPLAAALILGGVLAHASDSGSLTSAARNGPLELTLRISGPKVPIDGRLWFRLTLKNIGIRPVRINSSIFKDPRWLAENRESKKFGYLVVLGPDGTETFRFPDWTMPFFCHPKTIITEHPAGSKPPDVEEEDFIGTIMADPRLKRMPLSPGGSISTPAWAAPRWVNCEPVPRPPLGEFTELWSVPFDSTGTYKVRAVYDQRISPRIKEIIGPKESYGAVRVETPWLQVTVP